MNTNVLSGKDGVLTVGSNNVGMINTWNISVTVGSTDISAIGDEWASYKDTIKSWSGSISGFLSYSDAAQKEIVDQILNSEITEVQATFKANNGLVFSGTILLTSMSIGADVSNVVTLSANFNGNGTLTNSSASTSTASVSKE